MKTLVNMKTLIFILCLGLMVAGCKKNNETPYQSQGIITGYDLRTCQTCGGIEIIIANDTAKNPPPFYDINSTLPQLGISANSKFPIDVSLNWKHDPSALGSIIVSQIKVTN